MTINDTLSEVPWESSIAIQSKRPYDLFQLIYMHKFNVYFVSYKDKCSNEIALIIVHINNLIP